MPKLKKVEEVVIPETVAPEVEPAEEVVFAVEAVEAVADVAEDAEMKTDTWVPPAVQHEIAISTTPWIEVWRNEMFNVRVNNDGHVVLHRNDGNGEILLGVLDLDVSSLTETMLNLHAKRVAALTLSTIKIR